MEQIQQLWKYQEMDLEVDRFENSIKTMPIRRKLVKLRNTILDQSKLVERMEKDVESRQARLEKLQEFYQELVGRVNDEIEEIDEDEEWELEELAQMRQDSQELLDALGRLEKEAQQNAAEMAQIETRLKEIGVSLGRAKKEFPVVRAEYEQELKRLNPELEALRIKRDQEGEAIDPKLLERYKTVKSQRTPALAKILHDQCSGCNMSLPSQVVHVVKSAQRVVECENCGRILLAD